MRVMSDKILMHRRYREIENVFGLSISQIEDYLPLLDKRTNVILEHYFKLNNAECLTNSEIGDLVDLSSDRVRQIKNKALATIARSLGGKDGK